MSEKKAPAMYEWVTNNVPDGQALAAIGLLSMLKTQVEFGVTGGLAVLEELNDAVQ